MNINKIVVKRKCMSCGGCCSVCPVDAIDMSYNEDEGFFRPKLDPKKCVDCGKCLKICPAAHQDTSMLVGEYRKLYLAHSTNDLVRYKATSGGVINSLVRYLIDKDLVDGVLMTGYNENSRIEAQPLFITKENVFSLKENARDYASRYVAVPVLSTMRNNIKNMKKIAIVGVPCQMQALKLIEQERGFDIDIFKIGITCSGGMSYKATEEYKRIQCLENAKMYYRGDGWPGKNSLISENRTVEFFHLGSFFEQMFSSQIFKNSGCRKCKDHFAEKADISFCDFWDEQERRNETVGNSCVVIRSKKAQNIFNQMQQDGYVEVVKELTEMEAVNTQINVLKLKKGDLQDSMQYRFFIKVADVIFKYKIYKKFKLSTYQRICRYYGRLCERAHI